MTIRDRIIAMPHISGVSDERGAGDGLWVYYRDGSKSNSDRLGALHQDHEETWSDLYRAAKATIPCYCEDGCAAARAKADQGGF